MSSPFEIAAQIASQVECQYVIVTAYPHVWCVRATRGERRVSILSDGKERAMVLQSPDERVSSPTVDVAAAVSWLQEYDPP